MTEIKKTPIPEDKIKDEKPAEEAAELTDEEMEQVSGGYLKVQVNPSFPPYNG